MADLSGLTDALSEALAPICKRRRRHDPGRVLVDLAVTIAGGGDALSHLVALRHQPGVFGAVASVPTAFRWWMPSTTPSSPPSGRPGRRCADRSGERASTPSPNTAT